LFTKITPIDPKAIKSRKKISILSCTEINSNFVSIFVIDQKSRFLIKNAKEIIELKDRLILQENHNFKKNIFMIKSQVCSKAINHFKDQKWIVYNDFM
jgi:hypothetical protein